METAPPLTPLAAGALRAGAPERVLVVACGEGDPALFCAREFPRARIRGIDASSAAVDAASSRIGLDPEGRVAFKVGGPRKLPFPPDHFDLLVALDAGPAAAEAARVLRAGGRLLLVSTGHADPLGGASRWLARRSLARAGFRLVCSEIAGEGGFAVMSLEDPRA